MGDPFRCIGGLTKDGRSVRLMLRDGSNHRSSSSLKIGEWWDIDVTEAAEVEEPHTEDVLCSKGKRLGVQANLVEYLKQQKPLHKGSIDDLYEGHLRFTSNGNGYVSEAHGVPSYSTCFWIPNRKLVRRSDGKHVDYMQPPTRGMKYVGEAALLQEIPAGTLVRMSLARWWRPENVTDLELRCYLQLSCWYD